MGGNMRLRNKKTGEIIPIENENEAGFIKLVEKSLPNGFIDWEVVEDTNVLNIPLIKDEKIRKAVRAWAEANDFMRVFYEYDYSNDVAKFMVGETKMIIESDELLEDCKNYTIAELCGEEEE